MKRRYLINIPPKVWTVVSFWAHVFAGGCITEFYLHHSTSWKAIIGAGGAALLPVFYRYFNPGDNFPMPNPALQAADAAVKGDNVVPQV